MARLMHELNTRLMTRQMARFNDKINGQDFNDKINDKD
jgi:hypothetical protein